MQIDWAVVGTEIFKAILSLITGIIVAWVSYIFQMRIDRKEAEQKDQTKIAPIRRQMKVPVFDEKTGEYIGTEIQEFELTVHEMQIEYYTLSRQPNTKNLYISIVMGIMAAIIAALLLF